MLFEAKRSYLCPHFNEHMMFAELKNAISNYNRITFPQVITFFLGLFLVSATPYSKHLLIPIVESYRISLFYALEVIVYGYWLTAHKVSVGNKQEKF